MDLLYFEFEYQNTIIPSSTGGVDERVLAVAFARLTLSDAASGAILIDLDFVNDVKAVYGLYEVEEWGRWSAGSKSAFIIPRPTADDLVKVTLLHSICPGLEPGVLTKISLNGRPLCERALDGEPCDFFINPKTYSAIFDDEAVAEQRQALLVLGMHRSGTSVMSRVLSLMGATLPSDLMNSMPDNASGFWEPRRIADFNERLLLSARSSWLDVFSFEAIERENFNGSALRKATKHLGSEYPIGDLIVLKDPRISLMAPFWVEALAQAGFQAAPLLIVRDPLEVAWSLKKRNNLSLEHSLLLWAGYNVAASKTIARLNAPVVCFDELLTDPINVIERLRGRLGLTSDLLGSYSIKAIKTFVQASVRTRSPDNLLLPDTFIRLKALHEMFVNAAKGGALDMSTIDECEQWLQSLRSTVGPVLRYFSDEPADRR